MNFQDFQNIVRSFRFSNLLHFFRKPQPQKKVWIYVLMAFGALFLLISLFLFILLGSFRDFFWKMPSMLGFTGEKNYLILIQNNSERRPTGGFITAYGELSFFLGFPHLEFHDSYDLNAPSPQIEPPYPLNELLKDDVFYKGWQFRDTNWSPDFPSSAQSIEALYLEGQDRVNKLDGIIALDFTVMERLLDLVGGMKQENGQIVNSKNFFHLSQFYSKNVDLHSVEALENRKNAMKELMPALLRKILLSPSIYGEVSEVLVKLAEEKHFFLFFHKPSWQNIVQKHRWGGIFEPGISDFVHVNVANIGGRKSDRYIQPQYQYTVYFDREGRGHATLDLSWAYLGTQGLYSDFYQSYVRVYLPEGIEKLKRWGDNRSEFRQTEELEALSIGTMLHMWPGETQSLHFSYDLPADIMPFDYQFRALPMAGNFGENWNISIRYENNDNFWKSSEFQTRENVAFFQGLLQEDATFHAQLQEDGTAPVIVWQKFIDPNVIELQFSELLDEKTLRPEYFSLRDKNVKDAGIADMPSVFSVSQDEKTKRIHIKTQGVTWQYEEQFLLTIENITDLSGNHLVPNVKEVTLVQR